MCYYRKYQRADPRGFVFILSEGTPTVLLRIILMDIGHGTSAEWNDN